mmetsp:Transcript_2062/g.7386  ORF Transcript_2062/g.7386 Transcript_2062/m.7386 type:complete len:149 (-) Transcript_2062:331-777(-)
MRKTEVHALAVIASLAVLLGLVFHHHRSVDELHLQARSGSLYRVLHPELNPFTTSRTSDGGAKAHADFFSVALVTVPDQVTGEQLARSLLEKSLVACVNLLPKVTSMYKWEGRVRTDPEVLLVCTNVNASSNQSFHVLNTFSANRCYS